MIHSDGKNQFRDNEFSFWEWSAPILQTPEEVIRAYRTLNLEGRVIKDLVAVGMGYTWSESGIDDVVWNAQEEEAERITRALEHLRLRRKWRKFVPEHLISENLLVGCFAMLDEPLLILFEDGDILAISFDEGSCVRMELNTVPFDIEPGINRKTFHAGRLFRNAVGRRIRSLNLQISTEEPIFTGSHGLELNEQENYITRLEFVLEDGESRWNRHKLCFEAWGDYGWVALEDERGEFVKFPAKEIPWVTEGYVDFEAVRELMEQPHADEKVRRKKKNRLASLGKIL